MWPALMSLGAVEYGLLKAFFRQMQRLLWEAKQLSIETRSANPGFLKTWEPASSARLLPSLLSPVGKMSDACPKLASDSQLRAFSCSGSFSSAPGLAI